MALNLEERVTDKNRLMEALKCKISTKEHGVSLVSLVIIVIYENYTLRCKKRMSVAQNWWIMCIFAKDLRADTDYHCRISEFVA